MSRSYKKNPVYKDQTASKSGKKYANSTIRQKGKVDINDIENVNNLTNSEFKKHYDSYNIRDYEFRTTEKEAIADYAIMTDENNDYVTEYEREAFKKRFPSFKIYMREWAKKFKYK